MPDHDTDTLTEPESIAPRERGLVGRFVLRWCWLVLVAVGGATLAGFCASLAWWMELCSHFRLQYVYGAS